MTPMSSPAGACLAAPAGRPAPNNSDRISGSIEPPSVENPPAPKSKPKLRKSRGPPPGWRAKTEALELRRARLALRVDLAAIEGFALLVVAENLVGRADFGEALLGPWLLALVGVVFLGELPKGGFDLRLARRLGYAKNVIWIPHL